MRGGQPRGRFRSAGRRRKAAAAAALRRHFAGTAAVGLRPGILEGLRGCGFGQRVGADCERRRVRLADRRAGGGRSRSLRTFDWNSRLRFGFSGAAVVGALAAQAPLAYRGSCQGAARQSAPSAAETRSVPRPEMPEARPAFAGSPAGREAGGKTAAEQFQLARPRPTGQAGSTRYKGRRCPRQSGCCRN